MNRYIHTCIYEINIKINISFNIFILNYIYFYVNIPIYIGMNIFIYIKKTDIQRNIYTYINFFIKYSNISVLE